MSLTRNGPGAPTPGGPPAPGDPAPTLEEALASVAGAAALPGGGSGTRAPDSRSGDGVLQEAHGMALLETVGFQVPAWTVVDHPGAPLDLTAFPGQRVVVKLLEPGRGHRTEVGGVQVVPREAPAVRAALAALADKATRPETRYLVQEWVPHEAGPGGELLLGYRWTREFGSVVTLALGGVDAETLTAAARPGALQWIGAPGASLARVREELEAVALGALATGRTRGRAGRVGCGELARTVSAFLELARAAPAHGIREVEVNPLVFRSGAPVALDVLVRVGRPVSAPPRRDRRDAIGALLRPGSLAVVGASARTLNPGRVILRNVVRAGFPPDRVQVVKEACRELEGCRCVPDLDALSPVDLLVVGVAAPDVPPLLEAVARRRAARSVILVSAGLGEGDSDDDGGDAPATALERALAAPGAPVVNGGNCLGIRSRPGRYDTLFLPPHKLGFPTPDGDPHPVALVTQSGAFAVARTGALPWLDPRYLVTVGNQVDLTVGEYLEAFLDEPEIRVVAAYVEGFRPGDGARFMEAAARHREAGRTVLLYRAGRTVQGAHAMASHTASVAGDYVVTRALARAAGVLVAETVQEFQELLTLAVRLDGREVAGNAAGLISNAGFECVAMADATGLLVPAPFAPGTRDALESVLARAGLGGIVAPRNPLDLTPILGDEGFAEAVRLVLSDAGVDLGVVGCVPLTPALQTLPPGPDHEEDLRAPGGLAARLGALWRDGRKAWVAVVDGGPLYDPFARALEGHGIPVLRHGDRAVSLLTRYVSMRLGLDDTQRK